MYVHDASRLAYLAHPRTASCATAAALRGAGFRPVTGDHHLRVGDDGSPVGPDNRHTWVLITAVRNHWDAIASWLSSQTRGSREGGWTVADIDSLNGCRYIGPHTLFAWHPDVDVVWRYETLAADIAKTLSDHMLDPVTLPRVNVSPRRAGRPWRELLSPEGCEYVGRRFGAEIDAYGYHGAETCVT